MKTCRKLRSVLWRISWLWVLTMIGGLWGCPSPKVAVKLPPKVATTPKARPKPSTPSPFGPRYQLPALVPFAPSRGPRYAPLQIVELHNPLDSSSRALESIRAAVWRRYPGAVRWTMQMNPTIGKDRGYFYARALIAAHRLGIFWPYLKRFHRSTGRRSFAQLKALAAKSGVDPQLFELKLFFEPYKMLIERDMRFAAAIQKSAQAVLFVNGALLPPPYTASRVMQALDYAHAESTALLQAGTPLAKVYATLTEKALAIETPAQLPEAILPRRYLHIPYGYLESVPVRGPGDAPVHIVEFSDFTCVPCRTAYFWLHQLLKKYPKKMRFSFKYYPIGIHKESYRSSELAAAAQDRHKFWPLYDLMFREQKRVFQGDLLALAKQVGLDEQWVAGELDRRSYRRRVALNHAHGRRLGIRAVPTLLINGLKVAGIGSNKSLMRLVHQELWKAGAPVASYP